MFPKVVIVRVLFSVCLIMICQLSHRLKTMLENGFFHVYGRVRILSSIQLQASLLQKHLKHIFVLIQDASIILMKYRAGATITNGAGETPLHIAAR